MGYSLISLDNVMFNVSATQLNVSANKLTTTKKEFTGYESKVGSIDKFSELYSELGDLISQYKELLIRDAAAVREVGNKFNAIDQQMANLWKTQIK